MKDQNKITLNLATMLEAIDLWLSAHFKEPVPKAVSVVTKTDQYATDYVVTIEVKEPLPASISAIFHSPETK